MPNNPIVNAIGKWWLSGPKYDLSRFIYRYSWVIPFEITARKYGLFTTPALTAHDVAAAFSDIYVFWIPDPLWGALDTVKPPHVLLAEGGDDCDGWAMCHARAVEHVLGPLGWRASVVSYLADPWHLSHHFCLAVGPDGSKWIIQPQKSRKQAAEGMQIDPVRQYFGPLLAKDAADVVASWYKAKVVWCDVRDTNWNPLAHP